MKKINKKRVLMIVFAFFAIMIMLIARLAYIQLLCGEELSRLANSQYQISILGLDERGTILDRNLKPLTDSTKVYYYIIAKEKINVETEKLAEILNARQIASEGSKFYVFRSESYNKEIGARLKKQYKAYIFESESRYADEQIACHLVGYLNEDEKRGVSGLELMHQSVLETPNSTANLWADATGKLLMGRAPSASVNADDSLNKNLITTIDRRLQYICEKALEETGKSGAVLISESETGEIIAWASAPVFNPNNVESYIGEVGDCLVDKVSRGTYAPGSVFKIITAAAALETGKINAQKIYNCKGTVTIAGVKVNCSTGGEAGHGRIDMTDAMAQSCNCYFSQLGADVGYEAILDMAKRMGLGEKCFKNFPGESSGNIPSKEETHISDTTNISIGQGKLLVTPLQIMRVTSIIANGGIMTDPKLTFTEDEKSHRVISRKNASAIDEMLQEVMNSGTGRDEWELPVRGKTGTAEAVNAGREINNCFFSGYFPAEGKTYVVTVLIEDGTSGTVDALPIFKTIHNYFAGSL